MSRTIVIFSLIVGTLLSSGTAFADLDDVITNLGEDAYNGNLELGSHGFATEGNPVRAAEYTYLEEDGFDALTAELEFTGDLEERHFYLDFDYQNTKDYAFDFHYDAKSRIVFSVYAASLYHNLEHLNYEDRPDAYRFRGRPVNDNVVWVDFSDLAPQDEYGLQVEQYGSDLKVRAGNYPAHFKVDYWRLERSGKTQMRYFEHGSWDPTNSGGTCNSCHARSETRDVDRVIEQVQLTNDAHIGAINYELVGTYREFHDNEPVPTASFGDWGSHRGPGTFEHSEDPESRLLSGTARLSNSYADGLNTILGFTMARRENLSDLTNVIETGGGEIEATTDYYKASGDFTWTPNAVWTLNTRYRILDLDFSTSESIDINPTAGDYPAETRQNPDFTRQWSNAKVSFRPAKKLTLQLEYDRQDIKRDNTASPADYVGESIEDYKELEAWYLSEDETINRYKIGFFARPTGHNSHKINGWYQYKTIDNPSYGTSLTATHEGFLSAYMTRPFWGLGLNLHALGGENDDYQRPYLVDIAHNVGPDEIGGMSDIERKVNQEDAAISCWVIPMDGVNVNLSYAYFHTLIDQLLQFGAYETSGNAPIKDDTEYDQTTQSITLAASWRALSTLTLRANGSFTKSEAFFDPDFTTVEDWPFSGFTADVDAETLRELSEIDIYQTSAKAGVDLELFSDYTISCDYAFQKYEDQKDELFDGSVHTFMATVARSW
ncbi:MAG: hypothetical protein C0624_01260 [Desulfuromonas sp.]|nr:MAG: hypothetical protein C0624_01260 [Desulfuromonas sp.]